MLMCATNQLLSRFTSPWTPGIWGECCVQQVLGKKCTSNWRNELNREQMDILEKDLKGLKVRYELPKGSKRQYKFNGLVKAAKRQAEDP